jgi:hypothetical protein
VLAGGFEPDDVETSEWVELIRRVPRRSLELVMEESCRSSAPTGGWADFYEELAKDFGLSPVKVRAIRELIEELQAQLSVFRGDLEVVYWAVGATEPAGKPLEACRLVPVKLTLLDAAGYGR